MSVLNTCYAVCLVLISTTATFGKSVPPQASQAVRPRIRRSPGPGNPEGHALVIDAFGHQYEIQMDAARQRRIPQPDVYTMSGGLVARRLERDMEPLDVYEHNNNFLSVRKRGSAEDAVYDVDGLLDDGVFVQSQPWMEEEDGVYAPHVVSRATDKERFANDYAHAVESTEHFLRFRRYAPQDINVVVDLMVVIDNALYRENVQRYGDPTRALEEIRKYFTLVVALVDNRYSLIDDSGLSIRVRLGHLFVAEDRMAAPWAEFNLALDEEGEAFLDPNIALSSLAKWLAQEINVLPKYDHAMAFTRYDLAYKGGRRISGMAYIATICQIDSGFSCSVVEERGGFLAVGTAVHELGHSLGATHDGFGENEACPIHHNYVMAPSNSGGKSYRENYFYFSPCSRRQFKSLLSTDQARCLRDSRPEETDVLPGQHLSADNQCTEVFGDQSGLCPMADLEGEICSQLWCVKPTNKHSCVTWGQLTAVYGTKCGAQKICRAGRCVDDNISVEKPTNNDVIDDIENTVEEEYNNPQQIAGHPVAVPHAPCHHDVNSEYCRRLVPKTPDACQRLDVNSYCCLSCYYANLLGYDDDRK